jgi:uncharacterized protein YlzI (FlbEa/FlbD family)
MLFRSPDGHIILDNIGSYIVREDEGEMEILNGMNIRSGTVLFVMRNFRLLKTIKLRHLNGRGAELDLVHLEQVSHPSTPRAVQSGIH